MIITDKKHFTWGLAMAIGFAVVLVYMFTPSFDGMNAFHASDKMFNTIAKGSTDYIPGVVEKAAAFNGQDFEVNILAGKQDLAPLAADLLKANNISVETSADGLRVSGDLGALLKAALDDSLAMYESNEANKNGAAVAAKYNMPEKQALYVWWNILSSAAKDLDQQKKFKQSKIVKTAIAKGVEVGYNFYGIQKESAGSKAGTLTFALIFYVVYTMWWGYAIFFMFEGLGLEMKKGAKKEM
ncbi:MAG: hypothetical protein JW718_07080 [Desulfovibrionaceae bacterium]|nr:hypothetical protein [Desulfovibrionaceae bacterium]